MSVASIPSLAGCWTPLTVGVVSSGNCDWSMSMRTATTPASRDMCSATPGCVPATTLWMALDSRLLSPIRLVVAKCTLVPPVVVSTTPGSVVAVVAPAGVTFWFTSTSGVTPPTP